MLAPTSKNAVYQLVSKFLVKLKPPTKPLTGKMAYLANGQFPPIGYRFEPSLTTFLG